MKQFASNGFIFQIFLLEKFPNNSYQVTSKTLDKSEIACDDLKTKLAAMKDQYDHSHAQEQKLREDHRSIEKEKLKKKNKHDQN